MNHPLHQVWTFPSDSNPGIEYQTLQYADGSTSCNCKGWTRRVAADGKRSCKHTRWVDLGVAGRHCSATHSYNQQSNRIENHETIRSKPQLGRRKFAL